MMKFSTWWTLGLLGGFTCAFQDASPFIAFSTSRAFNVTDSNIPEVLVASAKSITAQLERSLSSCAVNTYLLISLSGVSDADLASAQAFFHLRQRMQALNSAMGASIMIQNVVGALNNDDIQNYLTRVCSAGVQTVDVSSSIGTAPPLIRTESLPEVVRIDFPYLSKVSEERIRQLREHDVFLEELINKFEDPTYTVIFITTPPDKEFQWLQSSEDFVHAEAIYQMDDTYPSTIHTDLKRDHTEHSKKTEPASNGGLFRKYAFLNPGVFMGLVVGIILLLVLYIGISAVASLEVSYMAFSKEMGPAAQKKQ